jgi:hypothetical protein
MRPRAAGHEGAERIEKSGGSNPQFSDSIPPLQGPCASLPLHPCGTMPDSTLADLAAEGAA